MQTFLNVLLVILVIAVIALAVLYFLGRRLEKRQVEQQQLLEMSKQTVSMLVIDKKKMKIKDSGLPKIVYEQTPKYMRWAKVPVVNHCVALLFLMGLLALGIVHFMVALL